MHSPSTSPRERQGAIVPLTALVLTIVIAMVAFSVDLGWIVLVQADLQNAADSAALAGADALMDGYAKFVQAADPSSYQLLPNGRRKKIKTTVTTAQTTTVTQSKQSAIDAAKLYASYNSAGGVASLTLNDSDVELGYVDSTGTYSSTVPTGSFPNSVKVTVRRDSTANGTLGLFFGPAVNRSTVDLTASAVATIYTADIDSFKNDPSFKAKMLPMTYDVNHWNTYVFSGKGPDGSAGITDSNGVPELQIYPSIKYKGNFGLLGLDGYNANASANANWIANGMAQSDAQSLLSLSSSASTPLVPLSQHSSTMLPSSAADTKGSWNWNGTSGLETSTISNVQAHVGETFLLPLFQPLDSSSNSYAAGNGQGSNYFYNIVQFVSVKIVSSDNNSVVVQGSPVVIDFNTFITQSGSTVPAGSGTYVSTSFTFLPPKLTQ